MFQGVIRENLLQRIVEFISFKIISPIKFDRIIFLIKGRYYNLTPEDRDQCKDLMEKETYLWLTRRKTHFTTYMISLGDWLLDVLTWFKGKCKEKFPKINFKKYTHAFINEDDDLLIEAVAKGVIESQFDTVFDCDWACALKVKGLNAIQWKKIAKLVVASGKSNIGRKYDALFDIKSADKVSCIELLRVELKAALGDQYDALMADFEAMIKKSGNITPNMLRNSSSFEVVLEIKR